MAGLYIHIPFCGQLCTYCDFHFSVSLSRVDDMVKSITQELKERKNYLNGTTINTLYFGGGTPSILSAEQLSTIIKSAEKEYNFKVEELDEFTIECNPEDLTNEYLTAIKKLNISRLSIGIQSFNDATLKLMNRRHTASRAKEAVINARKAGFNNISIDLIFGVPNCDDDMLRYDLEEAIKLDTEHISVYHLTIEDNTVLGWRRGKGTFFAVDDEVSEHQYKIVEEHLNKASFNHYEISNYAKIGYKAIHNSSYWDSTPYIGIGPSAHSFDGKSRQWNISGNIRYMESLEKGELYYEKEDLSVTDRYNEYVMTSLRRDDGVSLHKIQELWGEEMEAYFNKESKKFIDSGLLVRKADRVMIESKNFLLSDSVITDLMIIK